MKTIEIKKLVEEGVLRESHTSYVRGYVSRYSNGVVAPYSGKFGKGYTITRPNWESTRYSFVTYYLKT